MQKRLKRPYLKKWDEVFPFTVWIVDGQYIRRNIDEEFTNFGQHYRFKFIPKYEFWIDKEHGNNEEQFFIDHMLVEFRLMAKGIKYSKATTLAERIERRERAKSKLMKKVNSNNSYQKIHLKQLKSYSQKVKVWIVNGELVRDLYDIEFTEGGHDKVYHYVPKGEVWIDNDVGLREVKYVLLHEMNERNLMSKKWRYNRAHRNSSKLEYYCRHHPKVLDKFLAKVIAGERIKI